MYYMLLRWYCHSSGLPKHILLAKEEKDRDQASDAKIFGFRRSTLFKVVQGTTLVIWSSRASRGPTAG